MRAHAECNGRDSAYLSLCAAASGSSSSLNSAASDANASSGSSRRPRSSRFRLFLRSFSASFFSLRCDVSFSALASRRFLRRSSRALAALPCLPCVVLQRIVICWSSWPIASRGFGGRRLDGLGGRRLDGLGGRRLDGLGGRRLDRSSGCHAVGPDRISAGPWLAVRQMLVLGGILFLFFRAGLVPGGLWRGGRGGVAGIRCNRAAAKGKTGDSFFVATHARAPTDRASRPICDLARRSVRSERTAVRSERLAGAGSAAAGSAAAGSTTAQVLGLCCLHGAA